LPLKIAKSQDGLFKLALKLNNLNDHLLSTTRRSDFVNIENTLSPLLTKLKGPQLSIIDLQVPAREINATYLTMNSHMNYLIANNLVSNDTFFSTEALDLIRAIGSSDPTAILNIFTQAFKRVIKNNS
jgi:hypothetical protein